MRQITETVTWPSASGTKFLTIQSVLNNPNTVMADSILSGTVRNSVTNATIQNALVNAAENVGWRDTTNASGAYSINLVSGNFNFQASAAGYYAASTPLTIAPNASTTLNFTLTPISTGTVQGTVWFDTHPVISQVVAATGPANSIEYIELYNPTTGPINMGTNLTNTAPPIWVLAADGSGGYQSKPQLVYISTYIPTNGFYLITNTGDGGGSGVTCDPITISGVTKNPDACWRYAGGIFPNYNHLLQCASLPGSGAGCSYSGPNSSGIGIGSNITGGIWTGLSSASKIDAVGWTGTGSTFIYETTPAAPALPLAGMSPGEAFVRRVDTTTAWNTSVGNTYDTDNNSTDFIDYPAAPPFVPRIFSSAAVSPQTGTPRRGSHRFVDRWPVGSFIGDADGNPEITPHRHTLNSLCPA